MIFDLPSASMRRSEWELICFHTIICVWLPDGMILHCRTLSVGAVVRCATSWAGLVVVSLGMTLLATGCSGRPTENWYDRPRLV
jgi:hypothetical protein